MDDMTVETIRERPMSVEELALYRQSAEFIQSQQEAEQQKRIAEGRARLEQRAKVAEASRLTVGQLRERLSRFPESTFVRGWLEDDSDGYFRGAHLKGSDCWLDCDLPEGKEL